MYCEAVETEQVIFLIRSYKRNLKTIFGNNINLYLNDQKEIDFEYKFTGSSIINLQDVKSARCPKDFNTLLKMNLDKKIIEAKRKIDLLNIWFSMLSERQKVIMFNLEIDGSAYRKKIDINELINKLDISRRQIYREKQKAVMKFSEVI